MFNLLNIFTPSAHEIALDSAISDILRTMTHLDEATPEYDRASDQLVKLLKLKKELNPSWRPSPDALIGVLGTIATAILVLNYEKIGVVTSKAFGLVGKMLK